LERLLHFLGELPAQLAVFVEVILRLFQFSQHQVCRATIPIDPGLTRVEFQRLVEVRDGSGGIAFGRSDQPAVAPGGVVMRVKLERLITVAQRRRVFLLRVTKPTTIAPGPIIAVPDELWNAAADLSRRYPPSLVGRVLKLDPSRLKKLLIKRSARTSIRKKPQAAFYQLQTEIALPKVGSPLPQSPIGCRLQIERPDGVRLTLMLPPLDLADINRLCSDFWRS